jgi:hypothetical protein
MPAVTTEAVAAVAAAALVAALIALLLALWLIIRTRRLARLSAFHPQMPADLQRTVESEMERLDMLIRELADVRQRLSSVERDASAAVQRIGIVRFNPFSDTGGQQSFVLALLDAAASGFLISSLHSRQQTRVYLKQITEGRSETALSEEERQALRNAGVSI